jgi:general transcription factor 3C polypeptide 5 (transcription factor C subunit 1)
MSTSSIPVESLQLIYTVQHPCHVVNSDRAIETLGGRQRLVDIFTHSTTSQLTCSFTPSNIYERPLRADRHKSTGILIRLRRNKQTKTIKSIHVIGILDTSYSFESLADFQYLPMIKKNNQYESFLNRLALNRQCLDKENLERPCPLMCIPAIFSRFFDPTDYAFRPEPKARPKRAATTITRTKQTINSNKLTKRNVRASAAHHIGFDATTVPTGKNKNLSENIRNYIF